MKGGSSKADVDEDGKKEKGMEMEKVQVGDEDIGRA